MAEPQNKTYSQRTSEQYQKQKDSWMPWIEDLYLRWFTKDNKASYATKDTLNKSKVTGIKQVDTLQDGVNNLVAGQVGTGGLAQPIGDRASKEGVNRAERGGKDDKGGYLPGGQGDGYVGQAGGVVSGAGEQAKGMAGKAGEGVKGAGGYVGGLWGKKGEGAKK